MERERSSSGRGCLPALLLQPAQTLRPWPGNTWQTHRNSKGQVSFFQGVPHRILSIMPLVLRSLLDPTFLILCYSPCPTVCPWTWGVFFICYFHILRLQQISLHFSVIVPLGYKFSPFPVLSLFLNWHLSVLRTSYVQGSPGQLVMLYLCLGWRNSP